MVKPLYEPAPGFDDPLALLHACHERILERLDTLERLPDHLRQYGGDRDAQLAAQRILEYFDRAAPHHHADEDDDLFPLLFATCGRPGWNPGLPARIDALSAEHLELERGWASIRPALEALSVGKAGHLSDATAWIAATRAHLALEEDFILPLAKRLLTAQEVGRLGAAMAVRRGVGQVNGLP